MKENEWTFSIKELLEQCNVGENIYFDTLKKVPYAQEILSYNLDFKESNEHVMSFDRFTDI